MEKMMSNKNAKETDSSGRWWLLKVFLITFGLSVFFNYVSSEVVEKLNMTISIVVLLFFLLLGVLLDLIATAVTAADEAPFHAKAADKKRGAKESVKLIKNADRVSNVCADVIGDICGILTGATSALIAVNMAKIFEFGNITIATMLMTAAVTALTVFWKGLGKKMAINNANKIINGLGIFINIIKFGKRWRYTLTKCVPSLI